MKKAILLIAIVFSSLLLVSCGDKSYGSLEATGVTRIFVKEEEALELITNGQYGDTFKLTKQTTLLNDEVYFLVIRLDFISNIISDKKISPRFEAVIHIEGFEVLQSKTYETSSGKNTDVLSRLESGERESVSTSIFSLGTGKNNEMVYYVVVKFSPTLPENTDKFDSKVTISYNQIDKLDLFGVYQDGQNFTISVTKGEEE